MTCISALVNKIRIVEKERIFESGISHICVLGAGCIMDHSSSAHNRKSETKRNHLRLRIGANIQASDFLYKQSMTEKHYSVQIDRPCNKDDGTFFPILWRKVIFQGKTTPLFDVIYLQNANNQPSFGLFKDSETIPHYITHRENVTAVIFLITSSATLTTSLRWPEAHSGQKPATRRFRLANLPQAKEG